MTKSVRAKLTDAYVRNEIETGGGEQTLHFDLELKGFMVVGSGVSNSKSYAVQRDIAGRTCRKTIAPTNAIKCAEARDRASKLIVEMIAGIDPKKKVGTGTVSEVLALYLKSRKNLRPKSVEGYKQAIEQLNGWSKRPLASITQEEVEKKHAEITRRISRAGRYSGKAAANAAMRALRAIYNFALDRDPDLPRNPVRLKKVWHEIEPRERIVEDKDKPAFFEAVWTAIPNDVQRDYILFLLFTGARRTEAAELEWKHVDFEGKMFSFPQTKTDRLDLPMSKEVEEILKRRKRDAWNGYVFPSDSKSKHIEEPKYPLGLVAKTTGVRVSVHDLRRTFITVASLTDVPDALQKALVNHADRSVHGGYRHIKVENLRVPAQTVASKMTALCQPTKGKVLAFEPRAT